MAQKSAWGAKYRAKYWAQIGKRRTWEVGQSLEAPKYGSAKYGAQNFWA